VFSTNTFFFTTFFFFSITNNRWMRDRAYHNTGSAELWLWYIIAPVKLIAAANTKTGIHQPCEAVTNSAVNGPQRIPGTVA